MALLLVCLVIFAAAANEPQDNANEKPAWAKKKLTDYSDADMERLLDQWNVSRRKTFDLLNPHHFIIVLLIRRRTMMTPIRTTIRRSI